MNAPVDLAARFAAIPAVLREKRGWLLWRLVPVAGKPKPDKVPFYTNGVKRHGEQGGNVDRASLATFETALSALRAGGYDGLGFAMLADWGLVGTDLDHCLEADGSLSPTAQAFIAAAGAETYIEVSPSGDGLHIWQSGSFRDDKNKEAGVESFCALHYLTMTGTALGDAPSEIAAMTPDFAAMLDARLRMRAAQPPRRGRREAQSDLSLEEVASALESISPDDRDVWLKIGVVLGRVFNRSAEAWGVYESWSMRYERFDEDRDGNIRRMKEMFYERSQEPPRAGRQLGLGTLIALAKANGWERPERLRDADHYRLAEGLVAAIQEQTGERPVYAMGSLWRVEDNLWRSWDMAEVVVQVGQRFGGGRYCRKGGDFAAVARLMAGITGDDRFFADTTVGFATQSGFWRVAEDGRIDCQPLTAAHRQRVLLPADPELDGEPVALLKMLREAFDGHDAEDQICLLQQLTGCALTRSLWRYELVALLLGATSSGKSTFLSVLRAAFPPDAIAATSPAQWGREYYVAQLAGKALNIVGELDGAEPIPGGRFKTITGRDLVDGRHPTHQPFSFVCEAAHFFNSNRTPPTTDRDNSFFRRWRILHFANPVPQERVRRDLDVEIIQTEFGAFLGWALRGASMVVSEGGIMETEPHRRALAKWRVGNNSALEFLLDRGECALLRDMTDEKKAEHRGLVQGMTPAQQELYEGAAAQELFDQYKTWATNAGVKPFGRNSFYENIERGGALAGIRLFTSGNQLFVHGVRLLL